MDTKTYEFYEKIINKNEIYVLTQDKGFLDCSVAGYNFSCHYNYNNNTWSVMVDKDGHFVLCNKLLAKKLLNLLEIRLKNGKVR